MTSSSRCLGMDLTTNTTTAPAAAAAAASSAVKTPELAETEIPSRIQQPKTFPFSNGVLKRKNHHPVVVIYRECLKNHAASLGTHAVDGCGEFLPIPAANPADPTSLKCAACGCHRNFHRRDPEEPPPVATAALEYQPHHRHHPPPPCGDHSSPNSSPSPPPISSAYYPASAPHMLLALSAGFSGEKNPNPATPTPPPAVANSNGRKRFRTKFTPDQKVKMLEFAEKVEWKMQKRDEDLVNNFCNEIGVEKGVLKVWMHNNKNTSVSGKKLDQSSTGHDNHQHQNGNTNNVVNGFCIVTKNKTHHDNTDSEFHLHHESSMNDNNKKGFSSFDANNFVATNGSSSSS